ncbi:major capsid protein [Listeria phage List-36]|uniref:Major capsid protein n=14 Tax=Pecentumvirus TaxID=1857844 RepID=S4U671_9CAUD|nr:major capsid protein precursor [Listeria phage LP-125]YP_009042893.1 major head protein [Listeria phage LP-048]YP_009043466.1 major head protein [Listeria phage List-36]YP_009044556.1 major head protein [Listeria phage LP-083-2]YP_009592633.1 major head protein [Listeria phage LP-064]YP_009784533.1 major capsid protein precursor [Listeria phage LP-124]YP_406393.1 major head protein [Listeria phage P100]QDK04932.2 major capsid protein [Listeria phage LP-066]QEP53083.2 major capsid protein
MPKNNKEEEVKEVNLNSVQEDALKSFTTGYGITPDTQTDAGALRREFLDDQISMLTWTENDLTFYKDIAKKPATSTVAKYDVYMQHGKVGHTRFTREIGVAPVSDPNIRQKTVNMKFASDTKNISIAAGLVNNIQDPMQILTDDAIVNIAKTIEWASFFGDSDLSDSPEPQAGLEFDGLAKLINQDNVHDARGASLTESLLNQAAVMISKGYGTPTDAYMPVGVQADFVNQQLSKQTQLVRDNGNNVSVGFNIQGFHSARGFIKLHGSTVMENEQILDERILALPTAPQPAKVTATQEAGKKGQFRAEDLAAHEYKVVVSSDDAESIASEVATATVTAKDDGVKLEIELAPMYSSRPQFVSIYRKGAETGLFYLIARVPASKAENNVITFYDLNDSIPETVDVFVGEMSANVVHLFELLPMMRLPLAQINASVTFAVLWYGALALRAPKKWVRIRNVKYIPVKNVHSN